MPCMMLESLFGWRKASKCKILIKRLQRRLKIIKNKKESVIRLLRQDLIQLLKNGDEKSAFGRVELLLKEQSMLAAYELLENFCDFIIAQLPYISRHRDCPNDINEATSTLIFASARCADLPELQTLRQLFAARYGYDFAEAAVESRNVTLVNNKIREHLCPKIISDYEKLKAIEQISEENGIQQLPPETKEEKQDQKELEISGPKHTCEDDPSPKCVGEKCDSIQGEQPQGIDTLLTLNSYSLRNGKHDKREELKYRDTCNTQLINDALYEDSTHLPEKIVFLLEDTNNFHLEMVRDVNDSDRTVHMPKKEKSVHGSRYTSHGTSTYHIYRNNCSSLPCEKSICESELRNGKCYRFEKESSSERHGPEGKESVRSRRTYNFSKKIEHRQDAPMKSMTQTEQASYYNQERDDSESDRKFQHHSLSRPTDASCLTSDGTCTREKVTRRTKRSVSGSGRNRLFNLTLECSLDEPSNSFTTDDKDESEILSHSTFFGQSGPRPIHEDAPRLCSLGMQPPYLRTKSMPVERTNTSNQSSSHVHPKLPNYEELEAKFRALKKEYMRSTSVCI